MDRNTKRASDEIVNRYIHGGNRRGIARQDRLAFLQQGSPTQRILADQCRAVEITNRGEDTDGGLTHERVHRTDQSPTIDTIRRDAHHDGAADPAVAVPVDQFARGNDAPPLWKRVDRDDFDFIDQYWHGF